MNLQESWVIEHVWHLLWLELLVKTTDWLVLQLEHAACSRTGDQYYVEPCASTHAAKALLGGDFILAGLAQCLLTSIPCFAHMHRPDCSRQ